MQGRSLWPDTDGAAMTDHDSVAVLAHHVRRLDGDACASLVADLWAARGFATEREGRDVLATRGGTTRRIRVGPGGGSTDPPDVVVSLRGGPDTRAATAAGVRVLDPDDLAGMLRYAVDRSTAAALCERHLGAPPDDLRPPLRERLRARIAALGESAGTLDTGESPVASAPFVGGVLVLLVVGAAVGVALAGTTGTPSADTDGDVEPLAIPESTPVGDSVVATPTPEGTDRGAGATAPNASVVPGLTDDGIADLSALAAAHARSLLGRSYTLWMDTYRPPPEDRDAPPVQFDTDVAVSGDRFLVEENVGDDEDRRRLRTVYHDGEDWYVANRTPEGRTYERITPGGPTPPPSPNPDNIALELVADYLSTPATDVEGRVGGASGVGEPTRYRVVGRGTPPTLDGDTVRNYTAVALVDRDGVVRDLTVRYTRVTAGGTYRVRKEWTYGYLGETTVEPPAGYVERFVGNRTTPTGTPDG